MTKKQKRVLIRIIVSTVFLATAIILDKTLEPNKYLAAAIYLVPYFVIGYDILKKAVLGIFHGQIFDDFTGDDKTYDRRNKCRTSRNCPSLRTFSHSTRRADAMFSAADRHIVDRL